MCVNRRALCASTDLDLTSQGFGVRMKVGVVEVKEARWKKAWWERALESEKTLVSRIVDLWNQGRYSVALSLARSLGVEEDVDTWPVIKDPDPKRGKPKVGRWEECYECEGAGGYLPEWASQAMWWDPPEDPYNFFEPCGYCGGEGVVWEPQPTSCSGDDDIYDTIINPSSWAKEADRMWVLHYRTFRYAGYCPEEAKQLAWENMYDQIREDFPPDKPLPF